MKDQIKMKNPQETESIVWVLLNVVLVIIALLSADPSLAWTQERQYLVAGYKNALPNPAAIAAAGGTWTGQIPSIGVALVRSSNPNFLTRVKKDKSVELAGPDLAARIPEDELTSEDAAVLEEAEAQLSQGEDQVITPSAPIPNDTFYFLQWAHRVMDIQSARDQGITGEGVTVAIMDNGVDCNHPDLLPPTASISLVKLAHIHCDENSDCSELTNPDGTIKASCDLAQQLCVLPDGSTAGFEAPCVASRTTQSVAHGTSMMGIIAAICNNGRGVCGISPGVRILNVKVQNHARVSVLSTFLDGFVWVATLGKSLYDVRIINA